LPAAAFVTIQIGFLGRLVALDIQFAQGILRTIFAFGQERTAAVETRFLKVDQPAKAQFKRRLIMLEMNGLEGFVKLS